MRINVTGGHMATNGGEGAVVRTPGHMLGQGKTRKPAALPAWSLEREPDWKYLLTLNEYLCPACYEHVYAVPLRRVGGYRLIEADGGGHVYVCPALGDRALRKARQNHGYHRQRGVA